MFVFLKALHSRADVLTADVKAFAVLEYSEDECGAGASVLEDIENLVVEVVEVLRP